MPTTSCPLASLDEQTVDKYLKEVANEDDPEKHANFKDSQPDDFAMLDDQKKRKRRAYNDL